MPQGGITQRFLESTRGRIVALLRCDARTVEELAQSMGLTDNAVRAHLATLERDGLVQAAGVRRGEGVGKPSTIYELPAGAEVVFSRAYPPVLTAVLEEVVQRLTAEESDALLIGVGRRLAEPLRPSATASREARLRAGVDVLNALGGAAELTLEDGNTMIRGCGCPLAAAVARRPETCRAVESLMSQVIGLPVRHRCQQGERPSCRFEVAAG